MLLGNKHLPIITFMSYFEKMLYWSFILLCEGKGLCSDLLHNQTQFPENTENYYVVWNKDTPMVSLSG